MQYKVYKFGGASVKDAAGYENVASIIHDNNTDDFQLVVVLSAMGKMTNAFESLVQSVELNHYDKSIVEQIFLEHKQTAEQLNVWSQYETHFNTIKKELEDFLTHNNSTQYNFIYDQIVPKGEMLSTHLLLSLLSSKNENVELIRATKMIKTDQNYTDANINWDETSVSIQKELEPAKSSIIITQGFIGSDKDGNYTTLGREGSDYSAAIISKILGVRQMTIWKDVDGVYTADPKKYPEATLMPKISYNEAIEMTYYGAQVIHPKTIQPIRNSDCTLYVRSFIDKEAKGTEIGKFDDVVYPPVMVRKDQQVLYSFSTRDFSFINEENLSKIISIFGKYSLRINLMQNTAIQFFVLTDEKGIKNDKIIDELKHDYEVSMKINLRLFTIRHYSEELIKKYRHLDNLILVQKDKKTIQYLME